MSTATRYTTLVFFVSLMLLLATHWPGLRAELFPIDDAYYLNSLPQNPHLAQDVRELFSTAPRPVFHPVTDLSLVLLRRIAGQNQANFYSLVRLINLVIASGCAALVFLLFPGRKQKPFFAALAALLFAVHPLHVFPNLWISSHKDLWVCFFMLLTVHAYTSKHMPAALLAFVLALLSKQSAYGLLLWMAVVTCTGPKKDFKRAAAWLGLFTGIAAAIIAFGIPRSFQVSRLTTQWTKTIPLLGRYLQKTFFPWPVTLYYPQPGEWPLALAVAALFTGVGAFAAALWITKHRQKPRLAGVLTLAALASAFILPYITIAPNHLLVTNAYAYALIAAAVLTLGLLKSGRTGCGIAAAVIVLFCGTDLTLAREWRTPAAVFERNAQIYPGDYKIQINDAQSLMRVKNPALAKAVLEHAIALRTPHDSFVTAFQNLVDIAVTEQRPAEIIPLDALAAAQNIPDYCQALAEKSANALTRCPQQYPLTVREAADVNAQIRNGAAFYDRHLYEFALFSYERAIQLSLQQTGSVPIPAFEGLADVCLVERRVPEFQSLETLASRINRPLYCQILVDKTRGHPMRHRVTFPECTKRYPDIAAKL